MDPFYEFKAPQFVDFNNLGDNNEDSGADEFFNVDMESGEEWTTVASTIEVEKVIQAANLKQGMNPVHSISAPVAIPSLLCESLPINPPHNTNLNPPPRKPSNMVTSWGPGHVTRTSGRGCMSTKPHQSKKKTQGKIGRADLHATLNVALGVAKKSPRHMHRTPRRLGVGSSRLLTAGTPKRLGTNLPDPRLAVARPRSQVQRSLNTPTASRVRRKTKSPAVPIPFPITPEVVRRFKNRRLGNDLNEVTRKLHRQ